MKEALQIPESIQGTTSDSEDSISEVVRDFFDMVGSSRLEDNVRLDLHLDTGDIIARHEDTESIARLSFDGGLSAEEMTQDEFREIRLDLQLISQPTESQVVHD